MHDVSQDICPLGSTSRRLPGVISHQSLASGCVRCHSSAANANHFGRNRVLWLQVANPVIRTRVSIYLPDGSSFDPKTDGVRMCMDKAGASDTYFQCAPRLPPPPFPPGNPLTGVNLTGLGAPSATHDRPRGGTPMHSCCWDEVIISAARLPEITRVSCMHGSHAHKRTA
jgi:hypothetical protein